MRTFLLSSLLAALATASSQAGVLDLQSRWELQKREIAIKQQNATAPTNIRAKAAAESRKLTEQQSTLAFVSIADGYTPHDLREAGIDVLIARGDVAIARIPYAEAETLSATKAVRAMQFQRPVKSHLDLARSLSGTDAIHQGAEALPQAYTGRGVVAAIVDQGFQPNHINFLDEEGNNRIKYLSYMQYNAAGTDVKPTFFGADVMDAQPISAFTTDATSTYHGTHTLGILAGGYKGKVEVSDGLTPAGLPKYKTIDNPYYGVATGADIAVSCGELTDVLIAYGMDYMYSYATGYKKLPCVYSLSLGSSVGAHDPRSSMNRFLDAIGQETIICLSAGNEGDQKGALNKTLTEQDAAIKTFIHPHLYHYQPDGDTAETLNTWRYGQISAYGDDGEEFDLQVVIYRKSRNYRVAYRMPAVGADTYTLYCTDEQYASGSSDAIAPSTSVYAQYFDGYVAIGRGIDPDTGRFYCNIQIDLMDKENNHAEEDLVVGLEITGKVGHRYDLYNDTQTICFESNNVAGFDDGNRNGTISDMATGYNTLCVGAYNTRQTWLDLDGGTYALPGDNFLPGYISDFSSYGTLSDGRNLPHICAPGTTIMSSMSMPYLNAEVDMIASQSGYTPSEAERNQYFDYLCSARTTDASGNRHYWKQEVGTSMSTPFVAGNIALWLEADPTLTIEDVKDIVSRTAITDEFTLQCNPVQRGAGKFNALGGIKEVIRRAGVETVGTDGHNNRLMLTPQGNNSYNIFVGNATNLTVAVTSVSGATIQSFTVAGDEATLDASTLPKGVYIVTANGHSAKIAVK